MAKRASDDDLFDFGFSMASEEELEAVQDARKTIKDNTNELEARLDKLYNAIFPLLENLKLNPEKDYIKWPDRVNKIKEFETKLYKIYSGTL